jgi:hypothetical protein
VVNKQNLFLVHDEDRNGEINLSWMGPWYSMDRQIVNCSIGAQDSHRRKMLTFKRQQPENPAGKNIFKKTIDEFRI